MAQLVVMFLAPWVGYLSEGYGRKPLLILGFGLEAIRSVLLSTTTNYGFLLVSQLLDGSNKRDCRGPHNRHHNGSHGGHGSLQFYRRHRRC